MRALEISCETTDMEQDKEQELDWAGFLPELLRLVCDRLPLADVPRFGAVCRHWRSCAFPVYPADAAPVLLTAAGAVRCYSPHLHKMFVLAAPPLPQGSRLFSAAAGGWVMLNTPSRTVVLANLLDGSVHETPKREAGDQGFMCSVPRPRRRHGDNNNNNNGCFDVLAVFSGMGTVRVESWGGGGGWKKVEEQSHGFRMSFCCSPVMHKGMLYCLGQEGGLGVYDPGEATWSALPKPAGFGPKLAYKNCHLVGSQSELLAVLTGSNGAPPIHVLRLDEAKMAWKTVKSLGGRSIFTGTTSSVARARGPEHGAGGGEHRDVLAGGGGLAGLEVGDVGEGEGGEDGARVGRGDDGEAGADGGEVGEGAQVAVVVEALGDEQQVDAGEEVVWVGLEGLVGGVEEPGDAEVEVADEDGVDEDAEAAGGAELPQPAVELEVRELHRRR